MDMYKADFLKKKKIKIEYLYLDLNTCKRCVKTNDNLNLAIKDICNILGKEGYEVELSKIKIDSIYLAEKYEFLTSPTIRVNEIDVMEILLETNCSECGEICGNNEISCRSWKHEEEILDVPTVEMIVHKMLKVIKEKDRKIEKGIYVMPDNLKKFFSGKDKINKIKNMKSLKIKRKIISIDANK